MCCAHSLPRCLLGIQVTALANWWDTPKECFQGHLRYTSQLLMLICMSCCGDAINCWCVLVLCCIVLKHLLFPLNVFVYSFLHIASCHLTNQPQRPFRIMTASEGGLYIVCNCLVTHCNLWILLYLIIVMFTFLLFISQTCVRCSIRVPPLSTLTRTPLTLTS